MTDPLTPQDCDCRGLPFMPLEVGRLVDSDLAALSTGDEFKAAVMLWAKAWTQVPAASVPDDDRILARMAGYSIGEWRTLREMALKGWVKCSDGRLYHPLIADLAVKASLKRRGQSERANSRWAKARAAKTPDMPQDAKTDATASHDDAVAMQGRGTVKVTDTPIVPTGDGQFQLEPEEPPPVDEAQMAFDLWNALAKTLDLPRAKSLDEGRRKEIRKTLASGGLERWREALDAVTVSAFLRGLRPGSDGRIFKAHIDFLCQPKSYRKVVEGVYGADAKPPRPASPTPTPEDPWRRRVQAFMANQFWNRLDWGPPPGKSGCAVPAAVLAEFNLGERSAA